jgi:hypothetical protein
MRDIRAFPGDFPNEPRPPPFIGRYFAFVVVAALARWGRLADCVCMVCTDDSVGHSGQPATCVALPHCWLAGPCGGTRLGVDMHPNHLSQIPIIPVYQDMKIVPEVVKNYQPGQEVNSLQVIAMNALA